jgi:dinuclear metal center protein, YbgI family
MPTINEVSAYLNEILNLKAFGNDCSNNGLQFEGSQNVTKAVFGVDACAGLFMDAADADADFIFVHHGLSWGGSLKRITGVDAERIAILAANNISLYAAHLPLDANPDFGHNALIARQLELDKVEPFGSYDGYKIGFAGNLRRMRKVEDVAEYLNENLPSECDLSIIGEASRKVKKIGVISGGGAFPALFSEMRAEGVECLVTGEFTHESYHYALETGIPVIALGHYRSEIPGVLAVKELVEEKFGIPCAFTDIPTGF